MLGIFLISIFLVAVTGMGIVFCILMLLRNQAVYKHKTRILNSLVRDIGTPEFARRLKLFKSVSYNEMLWQFWRPLESFYKGTGLNVR